MPLFRTADQIFEPPTRLERIFSAPLKYLIRLLYRLSTRLRSAPRPKSPPIRVVCISDTHTLKYDDIPDGDLLIHAGDLTNAGTVAEIQQALNWLASLPHKYKVIIAGNHDTYLDPRSRMTLAVDDRSGKLNWKGMHYLQHNSITLAFPSRNGGLRKLNIYGAPQIPACGGSNFAFQYPRGQDAWTDTIPLNTDLLITHTPPKYHLDLVNPSLGCEHLLREVWRVKPRLHVFGHVHVGAGRRIVWWDEVQRAYESGISRGSKGIIQEAFDIYSWVALAKVVVYGATGIIWNRIWGGEPRSTTMINAALMYNNTGRLGNKVQVVDV
jgi:predicted MPP superfamily phosphohydrolase